MDQENIEQKNKSSVGSIIGIIVIIAVIVLGGLYFWGKRLEESKANENLITTFTGPGTTDLSTTTTNTSNATSTDNLVPKLQ